jgi:hypothetical protein
LSIRSPWLAALHLRALLVTAVLVDDVLPET